MKKWLPWVGAVVVAIALGAQAVRPDLTVTKSDPTHDFAQVLQVPPDTAALMYTACGDCHSDRTVWPWYSQITPVNWWTHGHVVEARQQMDLSDWTYSADKTRRKLDGIIDEVKGGDMPPSYYTWMHAAARLTDAQRQTITDWATAELDKRGGPLPREKGEP
jgi:hypothetical protein